MEVAERLRLTLKTLDFPVVGKIAASFGVAECPSAGQSARELLASADAALYEAKRQGRDQVSQGMGGESNSMGAVNVQQRGEASGK